MIILICLILGGVVGAVTAKRRSGNKLDITQYAVGYAIAAGLCGFVLTIIIERLAG